MTSNKMSGLGKFYAARARSALKRDQDAGYHWGYLKGEGKIFCTCGFVLNTNDHDTLLEMAYPEKELGILPLALIRGHHKLPSCKGVATALIVNLKVINNGSAYEATAFCQGCGKVIENAPHSDVISFVNAHEESCA